MFLNSALTAALDSIAERAADVRRAFTPGAFPQHDDVATPSSRSDFTLDPLAVTAPDGAYFAVRDARGEYRYTRDGDFEIREGRLTDRSGATVCGVRAPGGEVTTLRVDAVDAALGRVSAARVEPDGTLTYQREAIDPRNGVRESQRIVAGRIRLDFRVRRVWRATATISVLRPASNRSEACRERGRSARCGRCTANAAASTSTKAWRVSKKRICASRRWLRRRTPRGT